jgi:chemotaxis protein CheX
MEEKFDHDRLVRIARQATTDVFGTMLGMEIVPLDAYCETEPPVAAAGILSLIGFAGTWVGNDALLMAEHHTVDEEVLDAMAEMTNMILGNVKTELEEVVGPMLLSIPTVLYGRNFVKRSMGKREWVVIPFNCKEERIEIQICMAPNPNPDGLRQCLRPYGVHA